MDMELVFQILALFAIVAAAISFHFFDLGRILSAKERTTEADSNAGINDYYSRNEPINSHHWDE
ncbi:hypothetical protein [Zhongshania marina]|uniref:Uncharacterized protein n=1 Tax=Zhongshania marina TaxID=2304603 RepID=A0A2S4HC37_9GAMM|nr:hypothetical protein [Marortus luteolus]POP51530.1 hypothetical protein C0068_16465 [Marortus luteolus]